MIFLIGILSSLLALMFHYEVLNGITILLDKQTRHRRVHILAVVSGILCAHLLEASIFAITYWIRAEVHGQAHFNVKRDLTAFDYYYYSLETFTSLGYGDMYIIGTGRFLSSIEAVVGLLLLGWSSSFMFLVMSRIWDRRRERSGLSEVR